MTQKQHNKHPEENTVDSVAQLVAIVPIGLKWQFREIAARRQTTARQLLVAVLEEFVAREGKAAA